MNTISKGTLYSFNNDYSIYELNANDSLTYYLSMPNKDIDSCQLYLGFPTLDMSILDKNQFTEEISRFSKVIHTVNPNGLYIFCNLQYNELHEASNDNDDRLYTILLNKLHLITKDVYDAVSINNNVTINPQIYAIKQNNDDTKFIDWLEIRLNGFITSLNGKKLLKEYSSISKNNVLDETGNSDFGTRGFSGDGFSNTKSDVKVKKLVKPQSGKKGFSSFAFIILTIIIAFVIGLGLAYLMKR